MNSSSWNEDTFSCENRKPQHQWIKRDTWARLQRSPWPVLQQRDLGRSALERLNKNQGECELMGQQWQRRRGHSEEWLGGRIVFSLLWCRGWETGKFCGCLKFWLVDNGIIAWGKMVQELSFIRLIISVFNILTINRLAVSALSCSIANWIDEDLRNKVWAV